jgi:WD40 repeat protein
MRPLLNNAKGIRFQSREAVLYKNGQVLLWDMEKESLVGSALGHEDGPIRRVEFVDGSGLLVTETADTLRLWDALTGQPKGGELKGERNAMIGFHCAEQSGLYATVGADGQSITVWDPATTKEVPKLKLATGSHRPSAVALTPDGKTLASFGDDRVVQLWNVDTGKRFATLEPPSPVVAILYTKDGQLDRSKVEIDAPFWKTVRNLAP